MRLTRKLFKAFLMLVLTISLCSFPPDVMAEVPTDAPIEVSGDQLEYDRQKSKIIATGTVVITYKNVKMTCDKAEVFSETKQAYAEGHVYIYQESGEVIRAEKVFYDFKQRQGSFPDAKVTSGPWTGRGEQVEQVSKDEIRLYNASVTTCAFDRPHFDVKAKRVTIFPGDKFVARDIVFRVLGKPVFWWPYLVMPLNTTEPPFELVPGYSSDDGFYILSSKTTSLGKNLKVKGQVDYRSKRGVGGGVDVDYRFEKMGEGQIKAYIANDEKTPQGVSGGDGLGDRVDDTRGRFSFKHRVDFDEFTNVITEWNYFSDEFFLQDYFEREFRKETQPESYVTFTRATDRYSFIIDLEKRTNRFFTVLEKLPEVKFTWNRQEIMNTNFYYRAENQFVAFNQKNARSSEDKDVVRFDTFHELNYPISVRNWEFVPFANFRESWFSRDKRGEKGIERHNFGYGFDLRTRFYNVFDVDTNILGLNINKIRHVLEPSVRYDSIRFVSVPEGNLEPFDDIDNLFRKDEVTFGLENRFQTKRYIDGAWQRVDLLSFNTFLTFSIDDNALGADAWTKWRQEIQFRPYEWLISEILWEYDMVSDQFDFAEIDLILEKDRFRFLMSHQFIKQDIDFGGSSLLTFDLNYRLNDLWSLGGYTRVEFDSSTIEEWELRVTRDLHDWYLDFGYNVRDSEIDSSNKELFVELRLKAFPQFPLKAGNRASFSRPRIGRFVSGASEAPANIANTSSTPQY